MLSCFDGKRTWQKEQKKTASCPNKDNRLFCIFLQCVLQGLYVYCIWVIHVRRIESLCEESQIPIFSEDEQPRAVMITLHSSLCFCSLKQRSGEWVSFISVLVALRMYYCIKQSGGEKESELCNTHSLTHTCTRTHKTQIVCTEIHAWTCKHNILGNGPKIYTRQARRWDSALVDE